MKAHVLHLAAQAGVRESCGRHFHVYTLNNVDATQILLNACMGRPIERLVYASSSSVYGDCVHSRCEAGALSTMLEGDPALPRWMKGFAPSTTG